MSRLLLLALLLTASAQGAAALTVTDLKCDSRVNPLGVDTPQPRLSWMLRSTRRGERQTSCRILVATSKLLIEKSKGDLWDSGRVESPQSIHVLYGGKPLDSNTSAWWKVQVWDRDGQRSAWSAPATWAMGLLHAEDWRGRWIGSAAAAPGAPLLRREFAVRHGVHRATAYVCGLGYYELYLNGGKVGDHVLDPAQTDYEQRALYATYDVTSLLRSGTNAAGIMLGNGFFNQDVVWGGMSYGKPRAIFQLHIEYDDGQMQVVCSDASWRTTAGPVVSNNVYAGESYDARREFLHWSEPGTNDATWSAAQLVDAPGPRLVSQTMPAIKRIQTLIPVALTEPMPGTLVCDLGQNFAGWARLRVQAPRGTVVRLRFAEAVHPDGTLDMGSTGVFATHVEQTDTYICKGDGVETWEPRFTYHGFRYVELTGYRGDINSLQGIVVHTAVDPAGTFECSDAMLNRIHRAAVWTELSNLHGHPTDCPAREKCGWLGDAQISAEMSMCNFDMSAFWPKYIGDIATSWRGDLPGDVAPGKRGSGPNGHLDWGVAAVLLPWYQYLYYGDRALLREQYPAMCKFVRNAWPLAVDGIYSKGYGDWCPPGSVEPIETPPALTTTAVLCHAAQVTARAAHALGYETDAREFEQLGDATKAAFNRHFLQAATHTYGSQTGNSVALGLGLVPPGEAGAVAISLAQDVEVTHHDHLATGIFGSRYLYGALTESGHGDTALGILHQTTYPSIGYLFSLGATTLWECWGEPELDQRWGPRSRNHPMQGGFDAWFYQGVAGINPVPDDPGFKRIVLRPGLVAQLQWARASYQSPYGAIESAWRHEGTRFDWRIAVPPNTVATLYVPTSAAATVREGDRQAAGASGVRYLRREMGAAVYEIGSGSYHFTARLNPGGW